MKDLVILAADKDMDLALHGLLARPDALGIRAVEADIFVEPEHDPACALRGVGFLTTFAGLYRHGLLIFDQEGSGLEGTPVAEVQDRLNGDFGRSAWGDRARAIVISPELENWVWSTSPHVDEVTGWRDRKPRLREWLVAQGWLSIGAAKPSRPKEAFEAALREARKPRSASLYRHLAEKVTLRSCVDVAFRQFADTMRVWFPRPEGGSVHDASY